NAAMLTQTAMGAGTITGTEIPDFYEFTALIPAALDMSINASLPGQDPADTPIDALPIVLPAAGTIRVVGDGTIEMTMTLAPDPIALEIPIQDATLPAIPFELPTFGTETASVIYTAMPEMVTVNTTLGMTIITQGSASGCVADFNNDGDLNFFDVSAFLGAFSAMDPSADLTGDGVFNFFDVSAFLAAYTQGCP
ncbi:MAG: GC-type dockerin domain-anchored protein, partial [Phycisphaerales bacterium]